MFPLETVHWRRERRLLSGACQANGEALVVARRPSAAAVAGGNRCRSRRLRAPSSCTLSARKGWTPSGKALKSSQIKGGPPWRRSDSDSPRQGVPVGTRTAFFEPVVGCHGSRLRAVREVAGAGRRCSLGQRPCCRREHASRRAGYWVICRREAVRRRRAALVSAGDGTRPPRAPPIHARNPGGRTPWFPRGGDV